MIRLFQYFMVMMWVAQAYGFHTQPELKPLLDLQTNSIIRRSGILTGGLIKLSVVEVHKRSDDGTPIEFFERWHYACAKCEKPKGTCSCSTSTLPSIGSPSLSRNAEKITDSRPYAPLRVDEESSLVSPGLQDLKQEPNRFIQAIAACITFPQLLCATCASDDEEVQLNSCYEEYVSPFRVPLAYTENRCCDCMFTFCPCCMPQEEV